MGCILSTTTAQKETSEKRTQVKQPIQESIVYISTDPDLGWRNIGDTAVSYPCNSFLVDYQNERSAYILKRIDLVALAINIAERSGRLANRYGIADTNALQSFSNLLAEDGEQTRDWQQSVERDMKKILKQCSCPNFKWTLVTRTFLTAPLIQSRPEIFFNGDHGGNPDAGDGPVGALLSDLSNIPEYLQLLVDSKGKRTLVDVCEIAINIAEQLFRLEKADNTEHRIPSDIFGWKILEGAMSPPAGQSASSALPTRESLAVLVSTPDGEALMLIPEELIMHVASWVQQTYLTAPAF